MKDVQAHWRSLSLQLKERDPVLAKLIEKIGAPELELLKNHFQALVQCILSQQLAPKAATTIINRFTDLERPFPKPASVAKWRTPKLRAVGVSGQKAGYLVGLAKLWETEWRKGWSQLSDECLMQRLMEVKGIGEWTAHMFLIFSLGKPNILPIGDYGVRRGMQLLFRLKAVPTPSEIPGLVPHWEGAYSVGSWYLWRALDAKLLKAIEVG